MTPHQRAPVTRNDPEVRMSNAVVMADVGDIADHIRLEELNREHFSRWIQALSDAEMNARRLREQLEEILASSRR
jgi:hypothetical protein